MKIIFAVIGILCMGLMSVHANNPLRQSPYPQKDNIIYLNPAPLLVPLSMKQSDYLQFNLSQIRTSKETTIFSPNLYPGACSMPIRY